MNGTVETDSQNWSILRKIVKSYLKIIVVGTMGEASRIAQLFVKLVIDQVVRTTLRLYANQRSLDPDKDQTDQMIGNVGPRINVPIDVIFMMLNTVMTALRIVLTIAQPWKT